MRVRFAPLWFLSWLVLVLALAASACAREVGPPLISATELSPREIDLGDRIEIQGDGFPQGRAAHVRLEGTVRRPGDASARSVSIELLGTASTPDRVEVLADDVLVERLCGRGDEASHATFRGDVEVAFSSSNPGAPPLTAVLRDTTIDVRPASVRAAVLDARAAEGTRVLAFLGIGAGAPLARGLPIERVDPGSLAERAGIQVGDILAGVDGVRVLELSDVTPASGRSVELEIVHGDSGGADKTSLPMTDYAGERIPAEYASSLVIVGVALALLVLLVMPGPAPLSLFELRIAQRVRKTSLWRLLRALFAGHRQGAVSVLTSAVIASLALTPHVIGAELDGVLLLALALSLLVVSRTSGAPTFGRRVRIVVCVFGPAVAVALAIGIAGVHAGAMQLTELVRAQGGAPWEAAAARHPVSVLLLVTYLVAMVTILRVRAPAASGIASTFERVAVLVLSAVAAAVFAGGWQLPGVTDSRLLGLQLLGVLVFLLKTWGLAGAVWATSSVLGVLSARDARTTALRVLVPGLVLSAGLVVAARQLVVGAALQNAFSATLVALVALLIVRTTARVRAALARPEPHADPFV